MKIDRIENWKRFSARMEKYIKDQTIEKYGINNRGNDISNVDLISITKPIVCVWNILKYSLRIWNGKMKNEYDLLKIAHYAETAWTMTGDKKIEKI